jgi:cytochrome P450
VRLIVGLRGTHISDTLQFNYNRFLNVGSERKLKEAIRTVHEFADEMIRCRRERETEKEDDLLSRFMAKEENSPEFLRDIVISFILAGRDTTSSALSWFFWLLSSKPEAERNILKELENIRVRNGKNMSDAFTFDELRDMHYLHAAISEALRLYPPVPVDSKACLKDDIMPDGTFVGKGWLVTYHTYAMGRMESIWGKNCREFLPERWMENGVCRQESPFRFPVFHGGPRFCLGKDMAYIQMKSIAASVIERFEMEVVVVGKKEKGPQHLLSLTLRINGGLPVKLRKRSVDATPIN